MKKDHKALVSLSEFRIAIVGHRQLRDVTVTQFVTAQCLRVLRQMQAQYGSVIAISALAEGADSLFAEAALTLGVPLEIVRPFDEFVDDFPPGPRRDSYERLRAVARHETRLPFVTRSDEAYKAAMRWLVDHCDILVAVWDGQPAAGVGGTGDAVRYARNIEKKLIHVDTTNLRVLFDV